VSVTNVPPTAKLAFAPVAPKTDEAVTFSAAGSNDPDGAILSYRWDLNGDGVFETDTGTRAEVTRRFTTPGSFVVAVRVQDADGASATATATVPVVKPAFKLALKFSRKTRLAALLRGVPGTISCGGQCKVQLTLRIATDLARRTKTRAVIAKTTVGVRDARAKAVRLRLTRSARDRLRGAGPFTVTLTGSAVNAAHTTANGRLTIRVRP
jgi:PKD repeat protein